MSRKACRRCGGYLTARVIGDNLLWLHTATSEAKCPDGKGYASPEEAQFPDQDGDSG